jgi:hypothetical protein
MLAAASATTEAYLTKDFMNYLPVFQATCILAGTGALSRRVHQPFLYMSWHIIADVAVAQMPKMVNSNLVEKLR